MSNRDAGNSHEHDIGKDDASSTNGLRRLQRRVMSLGAAHAFDYGMQFILPIVLVRFLPPEDFGGYRLLWLLLMSVLTVVPMAMPQTLNYFLPRAKPGERRLYVHQTMLYLLLAGLIGSLACGPWNPMLDKNMSVLAEFGLLVPLLLVLCSVTALLDVLPTVDERVHQQATLIVLLTLMRTSLLGVGAWLTGSLEWIIWLLLAFQSCKLMMLIFYVHRAHGLRGPWLRRSEFSAHFRHAWPIGMSSSLYGLRSQADQWVAARIFAIENFAAFSVAAVLAPMVSICRQSVNHVFLPTMSRLEAAGDVPGMIELNNRANVMVATLVYPLLTFAFAFANELITLIYTAEYIEAAPVMRVYIFGLTVFVIELSSIVILLRMGAFALYLNIAALAFSICISWLGAQHFGLLGAALGSTAVIYVDRLATLFRIREITGIPLLNLQDWPTLTRLFSFSIVAALASWSAVDFYLSEQVLLRLVSGGVLLAVIYGGLWWLANTMRLIRQVTATPAPINESQITP